MSDSMTEEQQILKMERELAAFKSKVRSKNLREAISANESEAASKLEEVAAQKAELEDRYGDADDVQEVLSAVHPRLKVRMSNITARVPADSRRRLSTIFSLARAPTTLCHRPTTHLTRSLVLSLPFVSISTLKTRSLANRSAFRGDRSSSPITKTAMMLLTTVLLLQTRL